MGINFDIIISISVFSHLPREKFEKNLLALKNSLSKSGILLMTTHGDYFIKQGNVVLNNDGWSYREPLKSGDTTRGRLSGEEYGFMCVNPSYVGRVCKKVGLSLVKHIPQAIGKQDLYIVTI